MVITYGAMEHYCHGFDWTLLWSSVVELSPCKNPCSNSIWFIFLYSSPSEGFFLGCIALKAPLISLYCATYKYVNRIEFVHNHNLQTYCHSKAKRSIGIHCVVIDCI